ncbi:MAG: GTP-binding protein [bacterium]|nr:GTP-binding protein [bacterium]
MANYKEIIKAKQLEAGKLMTDDQILQCNLAIHTASAASAASGFIPIPMADAIPITACQVTMVIALGKIFDQEISSAAAKGIIGAAASTFVGRNLVKLIPIVGWFVSAGVAAGVTEAMGWTIAVDMAKNCRDKIKNKAKDEIKEAEKEAKEKIEEEFSQKAGSADNANWDLGGNDNEAEDFT